MNFWTRCTVHADTGNKKLASLSMNSALWYAVAWHSRNSVISVRRARCCLLFLDKGCFGSTELAIRHRGGAVGFKHGCALLTVMNISQTVYLGCDADGLNPVGWALQSVSWCEFICLCWKESFLLVNLFIFFVNVSVLWLRFFTPGLKAFGKVL